MKTKFIQVCFSIFCISNVLAQPYNYNNWAIGNNGGISFNNGTLTQFQSSMNCQDISSTISDENGQVLFYCNGTTVWDKTNNIMANGTGLLGDITGGHTALIVPQPETKFYYIFTIDKYADNDGLRYHIVDIYANSGLGEVISKNNVLLNPSSEKIAAVWNAYQSSFKIITHAFGSNQFSVFNLDASGLDLTPVNSSIGSAHSSGNYGQAHDALGQLSVSPDGTKIGLALAFSGNFELFDFDINTGIISNPIVIPGFPLAWGIEFSPNSRNIYFTQWTYADVYQADITNWNASAIQSTIVQIGSISNAGQYSVGYLERTPDGRIFIAKYGYTNLAVISNPDNTGIACNFDPSGILLQYGVSNAGLSDSPVYPNYLSGISTINLEELISIYPNPNNGRFFLSMDLEIEVNAIELFDLAGKKQNISILKREKEFEIQGNFEKGYYLIRLISKDGQSSTKKVVIE